MKNSSNIDTIKLLNIQEFASKYGVKFAVSSSKGYRSFERALYRAENGLPAYEGTQAIEYKEVK